MDFTSKTLFPGESASVLTEEAPATNPNNIIVSGQHLVGVDQIHFMLHDPQFIPNPQSAAAAGVVFDKVKLYIPGRQYKGGYYGISHKYGRTFVKFSLARVLSRGANNIQLSSVDQAKGVINRLQGDLDALGIKTDIWKASVVHLELFSDAVLPRPYLDYKPLLDALHVSRRKRSVVEGSYYFKNKQRQDVVYDKLAKMLDNGDDVTDVPQVLVRYEIRYINGDAVKIAGISVALDLVTKWDHLHQVYVNQAKRLFRYDEILPGVVELDDLVSLVHLKKDVQRSLYAHAIINRVGGIDQLRQLLRSSGYGAKRIGRVTADVLKGLQQPLSNELVNINDLKREMFVGLMKGLEEGNYDTLK